MKELREVPNIVILKSLDFLFIGYNQHSLISEVLNIPIVPSHISS